MFNSTIESELFKATALFPQMGMAVPSKASVRAEVPPPAGQPRQPIRVAQMPRIVPVGLGCAV